MNHEVLLRSPFSRVSLESEQPTDVAPEELVESTKNLVKAAMEKVRQGAVKDYEQSVVVRNHETGRAYRLTDEEVFVDAKGTVTSVGKTHTGLSVYPVHISVSGHCTEGFGGIIVPRDPNLVNPDTIRRISTVLPGAMADVADQIKEAEIVR